MVQRGPENPELIQTIRLLKKAGSANSAPIWKTAAFYLEKPTRQRVEVNLKKLDLLSDGHVLLVPGKVLGMGLVTKKFTVAAFSYAKPARLNLEKAGCTVLSIPALVAQNPKGSKVKLVI